MFAVPGWSVSSDSLKRDVGKPRKEKGSSKKRKAPGNAEKPGREKIAKTESVSKGKSQSRFGNRTRTPGSSTPTESERPRKKTKVDHGAKKRAEPKFKKEKTSRQANAVERNEQVKLDADRAPAQDFQRIPGEQPLKPPPRSVANPNVQLTPLQSAMRAKLMGSRFRYLNELLYTKPSPESMALFKDNPTFFEEYHAGFRQQVSTWPESPVDSFIRELEERAKVQMKDKSSGANKTEIGGQPFAKRPLPRTQGRCKVADLGCGDAILAKKVKGLDKQAKITVDSYDLQSSEPGVIKADIANVPAPSDSVNVAVLCLALMSTNWVDVVEEAWRILHWKGELWVAEIKSRFSNKQRRPPDHSASKKKKVDKAELRKQKQQEEQEEAERTIAEMDGKSEPANSTDVSGFVTVLQKRGFDLTDEQSVDLSNKMFVRLRFTKSRPPVKGKHEGEGGKKKNWRQMLRDGVDDDQDETNVLQPCLYKVR